MTDEVQAVEFRPAPERQVDPALAVEVSELARADAKLDSTEAMGRDRDVRPSADFTADAIGRAEIRRSTASAWWPTMTVTEAGSSDAATSRT